MQSFPNHYLIAIRASIAAAEKIMEIYSKGFDTEFKNDGSPVTQADIASSEIIEECLYSTGIPMTGEESTKKSFDERQLWKELWCVDPLDGTKEFVKRNGEFCVNIALIRQKKPVFGIIASPTMRRLFFGGAETGVFESEFEHFEDPSKWEKINSRASQNSPVIMASSRSHHSGTDLKFINALKENHGEVNFIRMGSALKFFHLVRGEADVYPRFAPTMEWDIAAGQALLEGVGGRVLHAENNEPLYYNKENLTNPYFVAHSFAMTNEHR
jgi:3'(2'), 5'-bisphosphate nucleotidase